MSRSAGFVHVHGIAGAGIIALCVALTVPVTAPPPPPVQIPLNEAQAIATLHEVVSAQSRFKLNAYMDEDADGRGEYGSFGELSGLANLMRNCVGTAAPLKVSSVVP